MRGRDRPAQLPVRQRRKRWRARRCDSPPKWLFFGNQGLIAENVRHVQRKVVKYNQLVANLAILHNLEAMTGVLKEMLGEGLPIDEEILAGLAPYRTEHINRYGD